MLQTPSHCSVGADGFTDVTISANLSAKSGCCCPRFPSGPLSKLVKELSLSAPLCSQGPVPALQQLSKSLSRSPQNHWIPSLLRFAQEGLLQSLSCRYLLETFPAELLREEGANASTWRSSPLVRTLQPALLSAPYQRRLLFCVNHQVMLRGLWQASCFQKHALAFIPHSLVFTVLLWFYSWQIYSFLSFSQLGTI